MKYVETCLLSDALKNKLQGLRELKDIVKSIIYVSEKNRYIVNILLHRKIGSITIKYLKKFTLLTVMFSSSKPQRVFLNTTFRKICLK